MNSDATLAAIQEDWGTAQFAQNWVSQDWNYWDMVGYPQAGTNLLQFFTVPAGGMDPGLGVAKKREQTNLVVQNQIGGAECFVATHLRTFLLNSAKCRQNVGTSAPTTITADTTFAARQLAFSRWALQLMSQGVLVWSILQKKWLIENQPFNRFAAGFGLGDVVPPAIGGLTPITGGANAYVSNSIDDIDGGKTGDPFSLAQPVFLAPSTNFEIDLQYPLGNAPAATNIYGASADQPATVWVGMIMQGWKVRPRS